MNQTLDFKESITRRRVSYSVYPLLEIFNRASLSFHLISKSSQSWIDRFGKSTAAARQ